jgi:exosortase A
VKTDQAQPDRLMACGDVAVVDRRTARWSGPSLVLGCCLVLLLGLYHTTIASLISEWSLDPLGHGYFIVPGVAYLAWRRRAQVARLTPAATPAALPLLGALSLVWLAGKAGDITVVQHVAVVAMIVGITWAVVGTAVVRALAFPFGLLLFAVPVGDALAPSLQYMTARVVATLLHYSAVPAVLDQHFISTASTRWNVSEACGGIHYVMAGLVVGYVYAGSVYGRWRHRVAFMLASALIPVTGNILRVYTTILLDEAGATAIVAGMGHYAYGLLVFTAMMTVLVVTCGRWRDDLRDAEDPAPHDHGRVDWATWRAAATVGLGMIIIGAGALSAAVLEPPLAEDTARWEKVHVAPPWNQVNDPVMPWAARASFDRFGSVQAYRSGPSVVGLYLAAFPRTRADAALPAMSDVNEETWTDTGGRPRTVELPGRALQVNEMLLRSEQASVRLWTWFEIDGRTTSSLRAAKLLLAAARLFRRPEPGLQMGVAMEEQANVDAGRVLADFVAHLDAADGVARARLRADPARAAAVLPAP